MQPSAIETHSLTKTFLGRPVVDALSFAVPRGSVCAFLGRNGSGKSTTIRMLMNLLPPTAGSATLLGLDSRRAHEDLMHRVSYVAESPALYDWMTVRELVRFTANFYHRWNHSAVDSLLQRFAIDPTQKVRYLSRGTYAQFALALAMGNDPELLILDEPAAGLDVLVRRDFLDSIIELIQREGRTVLFSSHLVHEVERIADEVVIIDRGRLVAAARVDDLKQQVLRFVVRAPRRLDIPNILSSASDGTHLVLTIRDREESVRRAIEAAGGEVLEATGLSLEEIFIDLVGAPRQDEAA
ncbi:MAG: ybhF 5 [Candidatus Solibacter sp.]|nr:ybhF 5 [Candidatus Solibacter sp.]